MVRHLFIALLTLMLMMGSVSAASADASAYYHKGLAADRAGNVAQAVKWMRKAADQGLAEAQSNLGLLYAKGQGVTQDYAQAVKWWRKAAKQGYAKAQHNLGVSYTEGQGVTQDYAQAVKWYRKAADQGYANAQNNLGWMYYKGQGVTQDNITAHMWFNIAASKGDKRAVNGRNIVAKRMTAAALEEAQRRARLQVPSISKPNKRVAAVQTMLAALGYSTGTSDGIYGNRTKAAIQAYQRKKGLPVDGEVSRPLVAALQADYRRHSTQKRVIAPGPSLSNWQPLSVPLPSSPTARKMSPSELFRKTKNSVWAVISYKASKDQKAMKPNSQGSAVAVSTLHLITNCHVAQGSDRIVIIQGKKKIDVVLLSADSKSDRCILVSQQGLPSFVSGIRRFSELQVGEQVFTVGSPRGLEHTLGDGLISGLRATKRGRYVQTSAPISPGSSGGGLFDEGGNLLGITTFMLKNSQALNFAIAAEDFWKPLQK